MPPPSRYPKIADNTLVTADKLRFPKVPGVTTTTAVHRAYHADYGPRFGTEGVVTLEPPRIGSAFPILVPQVDADGNGLAGIRMPELTVPLATYTGWNLRSAKIGAPDQLFSMQGSWLPFPIDKAQRESKHDPRKSIAERYTGRDAYIDRVRESAKQLAKDGFLLESDIASIVERSAAEWTFVHRP